MDTNPPDTEHWWPKLAADQPTGFEFFKQPPGDSPEAENVHNLPENYYERMKAGKDPDWIEVYVRGNYGFVVEGQAVFQMYRDHAHCNADIKFDPMAPMLVGVDFGVAPVAVMGQRRKGGQWIILDELISEDVGVKRFGEALVQYMHTTYPGCKCEGWGDPAGLKRGQGFARTPLSIIQKSTGFRWNPAPTNDPTIRLEAVKGGLNRMIEGQSGILIHPRCRMLRKGFTGGYHYHSIRGTKGQIQKVPYKNEYSHPHDALQYLLLGGGEHSVVMSWNQEDLRRLPAKADNEYLEI